MKPYKSDLPIFSYIDLILGIYIAREYRRRVSIQVNDDKGRKHAGDLKDEADGTLRPLDSSKFYHFGSIQQATK